ncbi:unnamed protein product [Peronospora destructor]|uniref:Integrase catalytic domain-containing protein n=1 Tax=Peronospora destructor TaxID=86335 RepID=A0AAV0V375_9STRA|nr:unnamed protein product [Peronospora destructor]
MDRRGNRYLISFVDHKSNHCRVFLVKTKDQATKQYKNFLVYFEKLFNCKIHYLRTDCEDGLEHGTLNDCGSGLPLNFWGDTAEHASYILNRSPMRGNVGRSSPIKALTGGKPKLTDIVIFGSPCTAIRSPKHKTLERRGESGLIISKIDETKGYRVLFTKDRVVRTT